MPKNAKPSLVGSLGCISSTLLIPLAARANGARLFPQLDPHDLCATHLLNAMELNVKNYLGDWATVLNVLWRTQVIKAMGGRFFEKHTDSVGINLGAGLSSYFQWFDNGKNKWLDADLPEVMALRKLLLHSPPLHCSHQVLDIEKPGWWKRLKLPTAKTASPVFLICEGVLMYLAPDQVQRVFLEIANNAPSGSEFVFDFISPIGIGKASWHPSVSETGAEFTWGIESAEKLIDVHPRLHVRAQRSVSEAYGIACCMTEMMLGPIMGGPMYGLIHLEVT